ncbi:unnamed protein product, partial [Sphagnum jensenii]
MGNICLKKDDDRTIIINKNMDDSLSDQSVSNTSQKSAASKKSEKSTNSQIKILTQNGTSIVILDGGNVDNRSNSPDMRQPSRHRKSIEELTASPRNDSDDRNPLSKNVALRRRSGISSNRLSTRYSQNLDDYSNTKSRSSSVTDAARRRNSVNYAGPDNSLSDSGRSPSTNRRKSITFMKGRESVRMSVDNRETDTNSTAHPMNQSSPSRSALEKETPKNTPRNQDRVVESQVQLSDMYANDNNNHGKSTLSLLPAGIEPASVYAKAALMGLTLMAKMTTCPGQKVKVRVGPSVKDESNSMLSNGEEIEVYVHTVAGFYQLTYDKGYVNKNTLGVDWVPIEGPTAKLEAVEEPVKTKWIRLKCPGQKVKIRSTPSIKEEPIGQFKIAAENEFVVNSIIVGVAGNDEEFEVYVKTVSGFFQLVDNKGYINKNTQGVEWIDIEGPTKRAEEVLEEEAILLKWLRLECPGQKVKVRAKPSIKEPCTSMINHGDEIEVFQKLVS